MPWDILNYRRPLKEGSARISLCHEGWYYLLVVSFVITGSVLREINLLVMMAGMMIGPLLINWRSVVVAVRGLTVRRKLPAMLIAGDLLEVQLLVKKKPAGGRRIPAAHGLLIEDRIERLGETPEAFYPKGLLWRVQAGEQRECSYRVRLTRRGRYRFGPLSVSSRYPIGLIRRTLGLGQACEVVVFPRTGQLSPRWRQSLQPTIRGERLSRMRPGGAQGDFHRLREWRTGDSQRWIHWRTTARRGVPIVREFELPGEPNFSILLDAAPSDNPAYLRREVLETSVSFAATLVDEICRIGGSRRLTLGCDGATREIRSAAVSRHFSHELFELLATIEPYRGGDFALLFDEVLDRVEIDTHLVVITARGGAIAGLVEEAARQGTARHRQLAQRLTVVDVTDERFADLFRIDAVPEPAERNPKTQPGEVSVG